MTYSVLTIDRTQWPSRQAAFVELWRCWQSLRQALGRQLDGKIRYACSVEQHRSGWPHVNVLLVNADLAGRVGAPSDKDQETTKAERRVLAWMKPYLVRCGFGYMATVQRARDGRAIAGYLVKLAAELDQTAAEVVKLTQVPELAPRHFRRLRASKGFLPPAHTTEDWTGQLSRYPLDYANAHPECAQEQPCAPSPFSLSDFSPVTPPTTQLPTHPSAAASGNPVALPTTAGGFAKRR